MITTTLELDDGSVYLVTDDSEGDRQRRRLGDVEDDDTAGRVPDDLIDAYVDLVVEHSDAVDFARGTAWPRPGPLTFATWGADGE